MRILQWLFGQEPSEQPRTAIDDDLRDKVIARIRSFDVDFDDLIQDAILAAQENTSWGMLHSQQMPAILRAAVLLADTGSFKRGRQLCHDALQKIDRQAANETRKRAGEHYRDTLVGEHWVVEALAKMGLYSDAMSLVEEIVDDRIGANEREVALNAIIKAQVDSSEFKQARKTTERTKDQTRGNRLISRAQGRAALPDDVLERLDQLHSDFDLGYLANSLKHAQSGNLREARDTLASIQDPEQVGRALGELALVQFRDGERDDAYDTLKLALEKTGSERFGSNATPFLSLLIRSCLKLGEKESALALAETVVPPERDRGGWGYAGVRPKVERMLDIASHLANARETEAATSMLTKALSPQVQSHTRAEGKVDCIRALCQAAVISKQFDTSQSDNYIREALKIANAMDKLESVRAFCVIAESEFRRTGVVASKTHLEKATHRLRDAEEPGGRNFLLKEVARSMAICGQHDDALNLAAEISDTGFQCDALVAVADCALRDGQADMAAPLLQEALEKSSSSWTDFLSSLAQIQVRRGLFAESISTAKKVAHGESKSSLLVEIARAVFDYARDAVEARAQPSR